MAGCFGRSSPLLWRAAVLLSVLFLSSGTAQCQGPLSPFKPTCPFINPPAADWQRWSSPSTWPIGRVPGLQKRENVVIPCGQAVLLDVPNLNLGLLNISGHLMLWDDPSLPVISINATAIVVFGQLTIGTEAQQFSQRVTVTLFANGTSEQYITSPLPATASSPVSLGEKVFAAVGGQINLHGMPGGPLTPSWVHLAATAPKGASSIQLDTNVSSWPVGGHIVIASTDYDQEQAEEVVITSVVPGSNGSIVSFRPPLSYMHWGDDMESGIPGVTLFQKAEVGLLTRNILIQGEQESGARQHIGGHFMIFQTTTPQFIEGVELAFMGQQGNLGRYPMHFHIGRSHNSSYVRKITVRNSFQRCVVVHATNDLLIEENVAFNVSGHCYMCEDGIETNNTFAHNLGLVDYVVTKLIPPEGSDPPNSDTTPAVFWMANPYNTLINNVAAGSAFYGIWYQSETQIKGVSKLLPGAADMLPFQSPILLSNGNTAHSCEAIGFSTYPRFVPKLIDHSILGVNLSKPAPSTLSNFNVYKNRRGAFVRGSTWLTIEKSTFSDNQIALDPTVAWNFQLLDSNIIAESANVGNPQCNKSLPNFNCFSVDTCVDLRVMNRSSSIPARTVAAPAIRARFGIYIKENYMTLLPPFRGPQLMSGVTFYGFTPRCGDLFAAFTTTPYGDIGFAFDPGFTFHNITMLNSTLPIYLDPVETWDPIVSRNGSTYNEGGWSYALRDADGSIVGQSPQVSSLQVKAVTPSNNGSMGSTFGVFPLSVIPASAASSWGVGFVVANSSHMLPLANDSNAICVPESSWNAYRCWGVCYRTLRVYYLEPSSNGNSKASSSQLRITREADGVSIMLSGRNATDRPITITTSESSPYIQKPLPEFDPAFRTFSINLLVGPEYGYTLQKVGGSSDDDPSWILFGFEDDSATCELSSKILLLTNTSSSTYIVSRNQTGFPFYRDCESTTNGNQRTFVDTSCTDNGKPVLEANLGTLGPLDAPPFINATLQPASLGGCFQDPSCGLIAPGVAWQYLDNATTSTFPSGVARLKGAKLGVPPFASDYFQLDDVHYKILDHDDVMGPTIAGTRSQTMYFWTSFQVADPTCYSNLTIGVKAQDGYAIYINNVQALIFGFNATTTQLQYNTQATPVGPYNLTWIVNQVSFDDGASTNISTVVKLIPGTNYVAVEVHRASPSTPADQIFFDLWLTATDTCRK